MKKINKIFLVSLLGITLLFITTGCQKSKTSETNTVTITPVPTLTASTEGQYTQEEKGIRTVSTVKGDVEVPANPKRVLADYIVGDVVALGVKPIALSTLEGGLKGTAFEKEVEGLEDIGWGYDPETVMALEPDLIILSWSDEGYEELSKIAPTVYVPYGEMTTEERVLLVGEALNKEEEARQALSDFDAKVEQSIQSLKAAGVYDKFATVAQYTNGQIYVAGNKHAVGKLLYELMGFPVPEKVQTDIIDADEYWGDISLEVFHEYVGDYFIHLGDYQEDWKTNEIINSIPAIKEGRTFALNTQLTWYSDIYSASALVDKITSELIALSK